jgi:hypothetical protein
MTNSLSSKLLSAGLFIFVPAAYLSMVFWRPADSYSPVGRAGVSPLLAGLMATVFIVSLLSWNRHRLVATLGFIACLFWQGVLLIPVL